MANFKDQKKIDDLRERLYARGQKTAQPDAYELPTEKLSVEDVPTAWKNPPKPKVDRVAARPVPQPTQITHTNDATSPVSAPTPTNQSTMSTAPSRSYRKIIALTAIAFFIVTVAISSVLFFFNNTTISGDNIAVTLNGPFTVGGGEAIPLQIGITNQNTVAIESATLIVTYPPSTQSATEAGKELTVERLPLDTVEPGETLNVPLRAIVFGEENDERVISAEVEYRVSGSNSTFAKEAEPFRFRIGSTPIVLTVKDVEQISSGQEVTVSLMVSSNAPNTLSDILVRAEYPTGFDYTTSSPAPVSAQNIWLIEELEPGGEAEIEITGVVVGQETDEYSMLYSVGVANQSNPFALASVFSTARTDFVIEQPFIDVGLTVNSSRDTTVIVEAEDSISVDITVENTLSEPIYDSVVELAVSGSALSEYRINEGRGFFDSINDVVRWESSQISDLREIAPGDRVQLRMSLTPDPDITVTPQLEFMVDVKSRRVTTDRASEELRGTASAVARVASEANLVSEVGRGTSIFTELGPVPPVAETKTTYTITLLAENGTNDVGDLEVTASLPVYVSWLDATAGAGSFTYNETTRVVTWTLGDVDANQSKIASFHVELLPSISQIGTTPALIGQQRLRATDLFSGKVIRSTTPSLTTQLSTEIGYAEDIGEVRDVEETN